MAATPAAEPLAPDGGQLVRRSALFGAKKPLVAVGPRLKRGGVGPPRGAGPRTSSPRGLPPGYGTSRVLLQPLRVLIPARLRAKLREADGDAPVFSTREVLEIVAAVRQQLADELCAEFAQVLSERMAEVERRGEKIIEELSLQKTEGMSYVS